MHHDGCLLTCSFEDRRPSRDENILLAGVPASGHASAHEPLGVVLATGNRAAFANAKSGSRKADDDGESYFHQESLGRLDEKRIVSPRRKNRGDV